MILRFGSTGDAVKLLQLFLGVYADGDFGAKTEIAVKTWQVKNGLIADGIVGPKTLNAMGLLDTDAHEQVVPANLQLKYSWLPADEYYTGPVPKDWLFLHHTAGWESPYQTILGWRDDTRGQVGTEFVMGGPSIYDNNNKFDGELVQAFPEGGYAWHLSIGDNDMHRNSVGLEICNFGPLTMGGYYKIINKKNVWIAKEPNKYYTYVGGEVHPSQVIQLKEKFRGFSNWQKYSDAQISKTKDFILWIAERDDIDVRKGLVPLIKKEGWKAFDKCDPTMCAKEKGLWLHTNVVLGKVDLFPQPEMIDMLLSL